MKGWIVGIIITAIVVASGIGLWATWDSTQTSASQSMGRPVELSGPDELPSMTADVPDAPPECSYDDEPVEGDPLTEWATVVVDTTHRLAGDLAPLDLVDVGAAGFETNGDQIRQIAIPDLTAMREAAAANDTPILVVSAYRSYEYQQQLFDAQVEEVGEDEAIAHTARPGHSEHQLGTTIDVLDPASTELTEAFAGTPTGRWVAEHAHEHGFVLSYPNEAREQTCYDFEPWHLRYVGRDVAQQIRESGLTPREWMLSQDRAAG